MFNRISFDIKYILMQKKSIVKKIQQSAAFFVNFLSTICGIDLRDFHKIRANNT